MKKNKLILSIFCSVLALIICTSCFISCDTSGDDDGSSQVDSTGTGSAEDMPKEFDYEKADTTKYISLSKSDYIGCTVTLNDIYTITDADVDEQLDAQRFKNKTKTDGDTRVTDQAIRLGDSAFIYYTGYLNGEVFKGGSNATDSKPYELSIGSGSFIPGFEEGLIGVVPNETSREAPHSLNISFPEDYHSEDLAGKAVVFKVWIEYTVQYTIPEFNDDYVSETLKFTGTAEEYKAYIKSAMQKEADEAKENQTLSALTNLLLEKSEIIKYPEESVTYWYTAYVNECIYYMSYYSSMEYKFDSIDEFAKTFFGIPDGKNWKEYVTDLAKSTVHEKLVFYAVAQIEGITVSVEDYNESVQYFINYYKEQSNKIYSSDEIKSMLGDSYIRERALYTKVSQLLIENCTVEFEAVKE